MTPTQFLLTALPSFFRLTIELPMKNIRAALLIGLCSVVSVSVNAVVLDSIEVQSNLYEPLTAKISVSELTAGITDDLVVALASREAHQAAGIVYDEILGELEFSLVKMNLCVNLNRG